MVRAACADFIWERRHNHLLARAAVDAYLDVAAIHSHLDLQRELADAIDRADELALQLNDTGRIEETKSATLAIAARLVLDESLPLLYYAGTVIDAAFGFGKR